ncbi:MAG: hypothetical protein ACHQU1_13385 [Gemmatimonadales bacterium]
MIASPKPEKKGFDKLGYGALALYVSLLAVVGLGVYGINVSTDIMDQNRSDRVREQVKTGRMLVGTEDRTQCRSVRFNNETAELSHETLIDCDPNLATDTGGSSLGILRDGFTKR